MKHVHLHTAKNLSRPEMVNRGGPLVNLGRKDP